MPAQALQFDLSSAARSSELELDRNTRLSELVRDKYSFVWRSLRRLGVPYSDVDDAVQEVFLETSRRLDDIRRGTEAGFLFRASSFVSKRVRRRYARRREDGDEGLDGSVDTRANPEQQAVQSEAREALQQILQAMPDEYREVFILFEMEQLTKAEVAAALDLPEGTVSSRIFRARRFFERAVQRQSSR
ncbi:RNA polymerase sigma factor RpoE [Labilithrix luteola]|uniref:RNA polymerase sigma factor RpoE n=1 Tax=Labilithrix luteola TaxID=1391654 RepID=A0A0K1Q6S5_9BACT|nr:sigma-70 family RNA polymerase sigma factor [Labilithrix luteola]AKV01110.1 RNA polymerase sigma factor RpoE [Labilithrix luteola]